jgi:NAD+ synthase
MAMTDRLSIALVQLSQRVGDLRANADAMLAHRMAAGQVDLVMFPEMQLIGYPAEDMIAKPALAARAGAELARMAAATADGGPAMLLGTLHREGDALYNAVVLLDGGKVAAMRYKHELPNYGTFDEKRHFASGPLPEPILFRGVSIGIPICEDVWFPAVCAHLKAQGAELILSMNGSPYEIDKDDFRGGKVVGARVAEVGLPFVYLNRVGGQDELTFDGASFVMNADGSTAHQLPDWEVATRITQWERTDSGWRCISGELCPLEAHPSDLYHAMMVGLRDYVNVNRFPGVILGLSGGIDSAICAAIAADALGPDRVWCVMMPSPYTSKASLDDAAACAKLIGCRLDTVAISPAMTAFDTMLAPLFDGKAPDLAEENIQSRIRGLTLMALSNKHGPMLVTTGNKSEMAVGYATIYGDMAGGYNPIKDAYKMTVFALSKWRNANKPRLGLGADGPVMPETIITKPPSAELRDNQKDTDSLPDYPILDPILMGLVEEDLSVDEVVARGFDRAVVAKIERLLYIAEYKRRQAPPGVKLGKRNFGRDRRYPITNGFRTG